MEQCWDERRARWSRGSPPPAGGTPRFQLCHSEAAFGREAAAQGDVRGCSPQHHSKHSGTRQPTAQPSPRNRRQFAELRMGADRVLLSWGEATLHKSPLVLSQRAELRDGLLVPFPSNSSWGLTSITGEQKEKGRKSCTAPLTSHSSEHVLCSGSWGRDVMGQREPCT